jgi:hypothetical protein
MYTLTDKDNRHVAGIYQNVLVDADSKVLAVILGHCVFGWDGKLKAKYFRHTLFTLDGLVLAKENEIPVRNGVDPKAVMSEAWELVRQIDNYDCPMIDPKTEWSPVPVEKFLYIKSRDNK